jgi:hypothetical protein
MGALFSFLGGSVFRMMWGEASAYFTRNQEHAQELARIAAQEAVDQAAHLRQKDLIQMQSDLGIKEIQVAGGIALDKAAADAFTEVVKATGNKTGVAWVDAWNACIRPGGATMALAMIASEIIAAGFVVSDSNQQVLFAFLGIFVADRNLSKRGK